MIMRSSSSGCGVSGGGGGGVGRRRRRCRRRRSRNLGPPLHQCTWGRDCISEPFGGDKLHQCEELEVLEECLRFVGNLNLPE